MRGRNQDEGSLREKIQREREQAALEKLYVWLEARIDIEMSRANSPLKRQDVHHLVSMRHLQTINDDVLPHEKIKLLGLRLLSMYYALKRAEPRSDFANEIREQYSLLFPMLNLIPRPFPDDIEKNQPTPWHIEKEFEPPIPFYNAAIKFLKQPHNTTHQNEIDHLYLSLRELVGYYVYEAMPQLYKLLPALKEYPTFAAIPASVLNKQLSELLGTYSTSLDKIPVELRTAHSALIDNIQGPLTESAAELMIRCYYNIQRMDAGNLFSKSKFAVELKTFFKDKMGVDLPEAKQDKSAPSIKEIMEMSAKVRDAKDNSNSSKPLSKRA